MRQAKTFLSPGQLTPSGFFFQRPKGIPRAKVSYVFSPEGLRIRIKGKVNDLIVPINSKQIVRDPKKAMDTELTRHPPPRQSQLMVNGFSRKGKTMSLKSFFQYVGEELVPFLLRPSGKRKALTHEQINDIFQLRLIY